MKLRWLVALAVSVSACFDPEADPDAGAGEVCDNVLDDDADGHVDCDDADCAQATICQPPPQCTRQIDCFIGGQQYGDYTTRPMPMCVANKCVTPAGLVEIGLTLKTDNYAGLPCTMGSINARLVKKAAVDGTLVTCTRLAQVASSKLAADANAIERANLFNLQAWESIKITPKQTCGTPVGPPFIDVALGGDFIVWAEIWSEQTSSETGLPLGTRWGWACEETGINVTPIVPEDDISNPDVTRRRSVSILMPPPQGYPP